MSSRIEAAPALSTKILRQAGQSLREKLDALTGDKLLPAILIPGLFWVVCAIDWLQKHFARPSADPRFWALTAFGATVYGGIQVFRLRPRLRHLRRGEMGERRVGEILDRMRAHHFIPVHDLVGEGFNIDHVLVGPSGIYLIETKTRRGFGVIDYRNERDLIVGKINENCSLAQARRLARLLHDQLRDHLHAGYWVKPLLVFVGDWKVKRGPGDFIVDVLAVNQLPGYFERQQPELTAAEIAQIASHLERSARS